MTDWTRDCEGYQLRLEDGVLKIIFNAPEARNPFRPNMSGEFADLLLEAQADAQIRCLLVQGKGDNFSAGGDIANFEKTLQGSRAEVQAYFFERLATAKRLVENLTAFDKPIVVRLRGAVAGAAMMFPLAADLVIGDETAVFVFAYGRIGLTPDGGVSWLLPRAVGERQAKRLLLTAATTGAEEALRLGLMDRAVPGESLDVEIDKATKAFAAASQSALRNTKALLCDASDSSLSAQLTAEQSGIVRSVGTDDFAEGVSAFLEKRRPKFA